MDHNSYEPDNLPDESSPDFQQYISGDGSSSHRPYRPNNTECISLESSPINQGHVSFGAHGTTATVSAYGELLQISKYMGIGHSGIFSADRAGISEPYLTTARLSEIQEKSQQPFSGFGLRLKRRERGEAGERGNGDGAETNGVDNEVQEPKLEFLRDRWPRITFMFRDFSIIVQLLVHDGLVLQQYQIENSTGTDLSLDMLLDTEVLIRDLDYVHPSYHFNEENRDKKSYEELLGPHQFSVFLIHKLRDSNGDDGSTSSAERHSEEGTDGIKAISIIMGLFKNGVPQKLTLNRGKSAHVDVVKVPGLGSVELTAFYRLQPVKFARPEWKSLIVPNHEANVFQILHNLKPGAPVLHLADNDDRLDYALRRNLEHILSVCCIPVVKATTNGEEGASSSEESETPIALTCGDFALHRISIFGSLFAFRFLLSVITRLDGFSKGTKPDSEPTSHKASFGALRDRIKETCKGHLKWTFGTAVCDGAFSSNYWTTGSLVTRNKDSRKFFRPDSPANMPVQILKAFEYSRAFPTDEDMQFVLKLLTDNRHVQKWVNTLERTQNPLAITWARYPEKDVKLYRLDDHVLIWKALKSVDDLIQDGRKRERPSRIQEPAKRLREDFHSEEGQKKFTPHEVRRQILRRFTTENDAIRRRMLAVARSTRVSRFWFHSCDTILYHGLCWGFFDEKDNETFDVWDSTVDAQQHMEDNQGMMWDNPLRYALVLMMGAFGHRIDRIYAPLEQMQRAREDLLQCLSPSGLFPGQIDATRKVPELFEDEAYRDFYFHATFEIPYVMLWMSQEQTESERQRRGDQRAKYEEKQRTQQRDTDGSSRSQPLLKKSIPFSTVLNSKDVVELSEEWLYDLPDFLGFEPELEKNIIPDDLVRAANNALSRIIAGDDDKKTFLDESATERNKEGNWGRKPVGAILEDIPKGNPKGKKFEKKDNKDDWARWYPEHPRFRDNEALWKALCKKRTPEKAKKRFIHSTSADVQYAHICFLTLPETERLPIYRFFMRHKNLESYFFDEAIAISNTWETELHFGFYQLAYGSPDTEIRGSAKPCGWGRITKQLQGKFPSAEGKDLLIVKATMGFRFTGDFFDRYWTCHSIEYNPRMRRNVEDVVDKIPLHPGPLTSSREPYGKDDMLLLQNLKQYDEHLPPKRGRESCQRKVLELILFERMVREVTTSAKQILSKIEKTFGIEENSLFALQRAGNYLISDWQAIQEVLHVLQESFSSIMEKVEAWEKREIRRGAEKPRWTKTDEGKYRRVINKWMGSTQARIQELKNCVNKTDDLISFVSRMRDDIRNDQGFQQADNIRLFTYVTVVFLPMGFAASIFSMSAVPQASLLKHMVTTAAVAFLITILALLNARGFEKHGSRILHWLNNHARKEMSQSIRFRGFWASASKDLGRLHEVQLRHHQESTNRHESRWWYVWFWIAYIFLELPERLIRRVRVNSVPSKASLATKPADNDDVEQIEQVLAPLSDHTGKKGSRHIKLTALERWRPWKPAAREARNTKRRPKNQGEAKIIEAQPAHSFEDHISETRVYATGDKQSKKPSADHTAEVESEGEIADSPGLTPGARIGWIGRLSEQRKKSSAGLAESIV